VREGLQLSVLKAGTEGEIDTTFASLDQLQAGGLVVQADPFFITRRGQLVALALRYAVPAIYELRGFAAVGGLISYGPDNDALARQAGVYAGRILKGARAAIRRRSCLLEPWSRHATTRSSNNCRLDSPSAS